MSKIEEYNELYLTERLYYRQILDFQHLQEKAFMSGDYEEVKSLQKMINSNCKSQFKSYMKLMAFVKKHLSDNQTND